MRGACERALLANSDRILDCIACVQYVQMGDSRTSSVQESAAHGICDCFCRVAFFYSPVNILLWPACEGQQRNCQCYVQHVYYFLLTSVEN